VYPQGEPLAPSERSYLLRLERQALHYFLENQTRSGLVLDRQHNFGRHRTHGLCSTATSGMGWIALALASAPPHQLLSPAEAAARIARGLRTALDVLPHDRGIVPHFIDSVSGHVYGFDHLSTVDSAWLIAGALWAAEYLGEPDLHDLAGRLYARVDWHYWTGQAGLLRHGKGPDGHFLPCTWDRLNGETAFMYVLAAGADEGRCIDPAAWQTLRPFYGSLLNFCFNNADLGLFVFQYGLDLLDLRGQPAPGDVDLWAEARLAALANRDICRHHAARHRTYRRFWGLSAGDGPGKPGERDTYRCYSPSGPIDGTAHLMASLASVAHLPAGVLENLREAEDDPRLNALGSYGFSNVNLDHDWVGEDMVGIDAGAAVLALDNYLIHDRVRAVFHRLACVRRGLGRLGYAADVPEPAAPIPLAEVGAMRQAS
jgi:hypothetical protein